MESQTLLRLRRPRPTLNKPIAGTRSKVLVISLASAAERRAVFAAGAPKDGSWSFVDAHDSCYPGLHYDPKRALSQFGRPLTKGEIGCYSSHYSLWDALCEDVLYDRYIILEDDLLVDWEIIGALQTSNLPMPDCVRLYYKRPVSSREVKRKFVHRSRSLVEIYGHAFGTQAYMITRAGAERLTSQLRTVERPVDDAMDQVWETNTRMHSIFPFPVIERTMESSIGAERFQTNLKTMMANRCPASFAREKMKYYFGFSKFLCRKLVHAA